MTVDRRAEQEEIDAAAAEAGAIGGVSGEENVAPEMRAVLEGGGGESEGFEAAEDLLIEHASHGDQQSAHAILHHQGLPEESDVRSDAEGDRERSSEREDEEQR